jgi:hypothetical protein
MQKKILLVMPVSVHEAIRTLAIQQDRSVSSMIRRMLAEAVANGRAS